VILLNGASGSGKSTLAKALQVALPHPFLHVSSDQLVQVGMLPHRTSDGGAFDWWHQIRPRFFAGFRRCLPAFAEAGNDLIVEHVIEFRSWRAELARLLAGLDVFLMGVYCDPEELDRRERSRGDCRVGEGRAHLTIDQIIALSPGSSTVSRIAVSVLGAVPPGGSHWSCAPSRTDSDSNA
jgi:chloramphenicol 3-O phosphotransferase